MATEGKPLILNTTVLSNFLAIKKLYLLKQFPLPFYVCPAVINEVVEGIALSKVPEDTLDWLEVLNMDPEEEVLAAQLRSRLGAGEAESIAVAFSRGWRFATDDRDARKVALQMGMPLTGTVGILVVYVMEKIMSINDANNLLEQMISAGYYAPSNNLEKYFQSGKESE